MSTTIFTIGHSTHSADRFISLVLQHQITAIADVRSRPYSRYNSQFNRETIKSALTNAGIEYLFFGEELGGRSKEPTCYINGKICYELMADTQLFQGGLDRIAERARQSRIAMMCAEKDPLSCHRTILIARHLVPRGFTIQHILEDGRLESQDDALSRLLAELDLPHHDLFRSRDEIAEEAYARQAKRIAYSQDRLADDPEVSGITR